MGKIFKTLKKIRQKTFKFVKKNWVPILAVVAVVFTAGIATVGIAGMSTAYATATAATAAGGLGMSSFSAAMYVAGSTLWAGATAIAGTVGLGSGASGFVASQAGMQGANLMTGALAAKLGGNVAQVNMANAAANSAGAGGSGLASSAGGVMGMPTGAVSKGMSKGMESIASKVAANANAGKSLLAGGSLSPGAAVPATAGKGVLGQIGTQAALTAGAGYLTGKFAGDDDPLAYYGVNMNGKDADFILPGQINPATGKEASESDARAYNEWKKTGGKPEADPFKQEAAIAG